MLITALGPIIRLMNKFAKDPANKTLAESLHKQTEETRDLAHKLSLDPLNLLTTPIERIMKSLEAIDARVPSLEQKNPEYVALIKEISKNLFESVVLAISNRVEIMDKLPSIKDKLENMFKDEKDPGVKLGLELIEELRGIQYIKWAKDGFNDLDKFASRDRGVRSVFGKNFNSWHDFLDASRDKFSNILSPEFLHQFRKDLAKNKIPKFNRVAVPV